MKTIYKYGLEIKDVQTITIMPEGAQVLSIQVQFGQPMLWALVDTEKAPAPRTFRIYGTGHLDVTGTYLATIQINMGTYIWHIFEE